MWFDTKMVASENWQKLRRTVSRKEASKQEEDIWFDVDEVVLKRSENETKSVSGNPVAILDMFTTVSKKKSSQVDCGKYIAMDCEFVGVGSEGLQHALARVSLVNYNGQVLLDKYVRPRERIVDYRSAISGIKPEHMKIASEFQAVQLEVANLLTNRTVIGHGLTNDFKVLMLSHPRKLIRDTSKSRKFRSISHGKTPSLKRLAKEILGVEIHSSAHDSVDDARVAMLLYRSCKDEWENSLFRQEGKLQKAKKRAKKALRKQCAESGGFLNDLSPPLATMLVNMK